MIALSIKSILEVINEVRNISRSLIPPTLGDLGLIDSIYDLIESINRTQPLIIELDDHGFKEDAIAENQKLMLFRIVQEQLNNILKHAQAQNVFIKVQNNMPMLYLEIKDDGKGFDMAITRKGLGLANIKNRAELFGGKMEIVSSNGNGCTLKVTVPDQFINSPN
jgi:signal transduction histidine kinase